MVCSIVITFLIFILVYLSMIVRIRQIVQARKRSYELSPSPLSEALKDFVAVAGGVYLGLMALAEFLKVSVPIEAEIWGLSFDPIAVAAITLAIAAPMFPTGGRY